MTAYLSRKSMDTGWTVVELKNIDAMKEFVGGPIESYELPFDIHLSANLDAVLTASYDMFSIAIVEEDGDAQPFFGNVFLASRDSEGNAIPLNQNQVDWLAKHSELVHTPTGQRVIRINPFQSNY